MTKNTLSLLFMFAAVITCAVFATQAQAKYTLNDNNINTYHHASTWTNDNNTYHVNSWTNNNNVNTYHVTNRYTNDNNNTKYINNLSNDNNINTYHVNSWTNDNNVNTYQINSLTNDNNVNTNSTVNSSTSDLAISTGSLPDGQIGTDYYGTLFGTGGQGSYRWNFAGGSLPPGLSFSQYFIPCGYGSTVCPNPGIIRGIPTTSGTYTFFATVSDANGGSATRNFTITINGNTLYPPVTNQCDVKPDAQGICPSGCVNYGLPLGCVTLEYKNNCSAHPGQCPR